MKRFTETAKWDDPWFRKLSPELKLLWLWLVDRCDNAGIIDPDLELASFHIGYQYPFDTLSSFGERIEHLSCGKWMVSKFIEFQYGSLSRDCKAHRPIFQSLEKHALKGYPKGIHTLQEKEKEKERETSKDLVEKEEQGSAYAEVLPTGAASDMLAMEKKIQGLRKGWKLPLNYAEQQAMMGNARCLDALDDEDWKTISDYLHARIPQGVPKWQPESRIKFIESAPDVYRYAVEWRRKVIASKPKTNAPQPIVAQSRLSREEIAEMMDIKEQIYRA